MQSRSRYAHAGSVFNLCQAAPNSQACGCSVLPESEHLSGPSVPGEQAGRCHPASFSAQGPETARGRRGPAWRSNDDALAAFRALRQEQKRTADLAAQLAQVEKDQAHQRIEPKNDAQAPLDLLVVALRQFERIEATLQEIRALVEAQTAAAEQDSAHCTEEQRRVTQLAEEKSKAIDEVTRRRDEEHERAAALEQRLARTLTAASEERAQLNLRFARSTTCNSARLAPGLCPGRGGPPVGAAGGAVERPSSNSTASPKRGMKLSVSRLRGVEN